MIIERLKDKVQFEPIGKMILSYGDILEDSSSYIYLVVEKPVGVKGQSGDIFLVNLTNHVSFMCEPSSMFRWVKMKLVEIE